jgi:hypothetical protein
MWSLERKGRGMNEEVGEASMKRSWRRSTTRA